MRNGGLLVLCVIVAAGCGGTKYYGVRNAQATAVPEFKDTEPPSAPAVTELRKSSTVAFFPPDACLDRRAAPSGTDKDQQVLRLQCGAVMTDLEKAAINAGFEVVSWQSLRGTSQPIEYAKERKVDLLFEINELDTVEVADRDTTQRLEFFEHQGYQQDVPVGVGASVANRCRGYFGGAPGVSGLTASLDVKMVSVESGRVLWNYRNTRNRDLGVAGGGKLFESHKPSRWWAYALIGLGGVSIYAGDGASGPTIGGGVLIGVGVLALIFRSYESPDKVICNRRSVPDPFAPKLRPQEPGPEQRGTSFEFGSSTRNRDPLQELRMALVKELVGDFTGQLKQARN